MTSTLQVYAFIVSSVLYVGMLNTAVAVETNCTGGNVQELQELRGKIRTTKQNLQDELEAISDSLDSMSTNLQLLGEGK